MARGFEGSTDAPERAARRGAWTASAARLGEAAAGRSRCRRPQRWQKARPGCIRGRTPRPRRPLKNFPGVDRRDRPRPSRGRAARGLVPRRGRVGQTGRVCRRCTNAGCARAACATSATRRSTCSARSVPSAMPGSRSCCATVSAAAMQAMLDELSQAVAPDAHAVILMDRAGWHIAKDLAIPTNLIPLFLPPYSPELNAIERVWLYLRERFLSHRLWPASTTSLTPAAPPGTPCSPKPAAFVPCPRSIGRRSVLSRS